MTMSRVQTMSTWPKALLLASVLTLASGAIAEEATRVAPPKPYELLDVMHQFQRYADKLYFSGKAKNWELADWYRWKLEAAAIPVIDGRIEPYRYEGFDAQPLMKSMLIPAIRAVESAIEQKRDAEFQRAYAGLVQTCNGCHAATKHAFVKIVVPTAPIYTNQDYAPIR
jgi:hypothetical protein